MTIFMVGCLVPIEEIGTDGPTQLKVIGEFEVDKPLSVLVSSKVPLSTNGSSELLSIDENFKVFLNTQEDGAQPLKYSKINDKWAKFEFIHPVKESTSYNISVTSPYDEVADVNASTTVPSKIKYQMKNMVSFDKILPNLEGTDRKRFQYILDIELDENDPERYVHIVPKRRVVQKDGTSPVLVYTNEYRDQTINKFYAEADACFILQSKYGFLVDRDKLVGNRIQVMFETMMEEDEYFDTIENQHKYIHLFTYAVTEDYYMYHRSASAAIPVGSSNNAEPVVYHSNIENGTGFLGGLNLVIDSVRIQN